MDTNSQLLSRISCDPAIFAGKPVVRGHRLAVEHILGYLASGQSVDEVLAGFPWMEREDVLARLEYARRMLESSDDRLSFS